MKKIVKKIKRYFFNRKLQSALKEVEKMEKHPERYKGYHNLEELMRDLEK